MAGTVLVYYTFEGNTGFVADELRKRLDLAMERLRVEHEPPKKGLGKFLRGGKSALMGEDPGLLPLQNDPAAFPGIILAYPVWAGTYPPAVGAFLKRYPLQNKTVHVIACSASGNGSKSIENVRAALPDCEVVSSLNLMNPLKNRETAVRELAAFAEKLQ